MGTQAFDAGCLTLDLAQVAAGLYGHSGRAGAGSRIG
jgi:hypothetical protein